MASTYIVPEHALALFSVPLDACYARNWAVIIRCSTLAMRCTTNTVVLTLCLCSVYPQTTGTIARHSGEVIPSGSRRLPSAFAVARINLYLNPSHNLCSFMLTYFAPGSVAVLKSDRPHGTQLNHFVVCPIKLCVGSSWLLKQALSLTLHR